MLNIEPDILLLTEQSQRKLENEKSPYKIKTPLHCPWNGIVMFGINFIILNLSKWKQKCYIFFIMFNVHLLIRYSSCLDIFMFTITFNLLWKGQKRVQDGYIFSSSYSKWQAFCRPLLLARGKKGLEGESGDGDEWFGRHLIRNGLSILSVDKGIFVSIYPSNSLVWVCWNFIILRELSEWISNVPRRDNLLMTPWGDQLFHERKGNSFSHIYLEASTSE